MLLQLDTEERMKDTIEYMKKYLSAFYLKYVHKNNELFIEFDQQLNPDDQIIQYDSTMNCQFKDFRQNYQLKNKERMCQLNVFKDNTLVLLTNHSITDGKYLQQFLDDMSKNKPRKLGLPDEVYNLFNKEIEIYNDNLKKGLYKPKYVNEYEIQDNYDEPIYVEYLDLNIKNLPELHHRLTQKLIIAHSLYKLYSLQKQQKLNNITELLNNGIAFMQQYIVDARRYYKEQTEFGSCYLALDDNYVLNSNKTVKQCVDEFIENMKQLEEKKEQYSFLNHFVNLNKNAIEKDDRVVHSLQFSNVGYTISDYYKNCRLDYRNNIPNMNTLLSFVYSFNYNLRISYHLPEQFKQYNVSKIVTILLQNIKDQITIGELWNLIKDL